MAWSSTAPLGTVSVKANKAILGDNTTYIETTMGNSVVGSNAVTTRDHFWNVDANLDGRHRFIQSPAFTVGAVPADPVIGTGMDGVFYLKTKSATEAPALQKAEPFHRTAGSHYLQMGFRCLAVWNGLPGVTAQSDVLYTHNVSTQAVAGIEHVATGIYKISFLNAMPSVNYIVIGSGIYDGTGNSGLICDTAKTLKLTTSVTVYFTRKDVALNPLQCWIAIVGG